MESWDLVIGHWELFFIQHGRKYSPGLAKSQGSSSALSLEQPKEQPAYDGRCQQRAQTDVEQSIRPGLRFIPGRQRCSRWNRREG